MWHQVYFIIIMIKIIITIIIIVIIIFITTFFYYKTACGYLGTECLSQPKHIYGIIYSLTSNTVLKILAVLKDGWFLDFPYWEVDINCVEVCRELCFTLSGDITIGTTVHWTPYNVPLYIVSYLCQSFHLVLCWLWHPLVWKCSQSVIFYLHVWLAEIP